MPKIEQYDWDKLKPKTPLRSFSHGTKDFATHEIVEAKPNSKHGALKITRPPKNKK